MSQTRKLTPNLDENTTKLLNLTVLQRNDPFIEEILITAGHVTLYDFNVDQHQWSRKDVEGSLFVVKRNTQPRFQFVVMNRRSQENLVENLLGDFEFELQLPYLLYRKAVQEVNGIWFYNPQECEDVANLFTRILSAYSKVSPKSKVSKSAFEELEAVSTSSAEIEGQLDPTFSTPSYTNVPEYSSFANFSNAQNMIRNNSSNSISSAHTYHNSSSLPLSSHVTPTPVLNGLTLHTPSYSPAMPFHDNQVTNLIKPLSFVMPSPSSSTSSMMPQPTSTSVPITAFQPPLNVQQHQQRSHGVPLLQPFPPPTPPLSLTPNSDFFPSHGPVTREKVRDALLLLAQDNQFIDMFYQALLKAHQS